MKSYKVIWRYGDEVWEFPTREQAQEQIERFAAEDMEEFGEGSINDYFIQEEG